MAQAQASHPPRRTSGNLASRRSKPSVDVNFDVQLFRPHLHDDAWGPSERDGHLPDGFTSWALANSGSRCVSVWRNVGTGPYVGLIYLTQRDTGLVTQ